jgi:hypothetical protein
LDGPVDVVHFDRVLPLVETLRGEQAAADAMGARFLIPPRDGRAMDAGSADGPS